ncbi:DoxX family protein [Actinopolyspora halophila]|uniref:DoxX family protein n=1 Tax=Actinopolyspora halophila TaxID=1850 RepID=UPI00037ADDA4|nr:DoxX family protein [Actinopolyspora halophila]
MLIRRLARPLLASVFIYGGIGVFRDPKGHAQGAAPLVERATTPVQGTLPDQVPTDTETLVKVDAGVKIGAGVLLALGKFPRFSALLLSGSLVPTTLAGHAFWEYSDPEQRAGQQIHFLKNLGLLGGLLTTAVDTKGKPSVGYRARHGAHRVAEHTQHAVGNGKGRKNKCHVPGR